MERTSVISQYHQLRDHLNRANKLANQKMEIEFKIEEFAPFQYRLYAISKNEHESHRIALAERGSNKTWERTGFSSFQQFEEFCALELNAEENFFGNEFKMAEVAPDKFLHCGQVLSNKIKMLLLNAGYEP